MDSNGSDTEIKHFPLIVSMECYLTMQTNVINFKRAVLGRGMAAVADGCHGLAVDG